MAEAIVFDVLARDRASATFNKISQSTATMESRMSKVISTAKGLATVLVGAQVGRSVLAAADSFELSRSRLETITKNIGANFGALSGQVDATDKKMAALGFTSADTEGALATLEAVTKNPTRALKDLALAADIARGRNIGLNESVLILSRVETGHIAQLAKLGIATKDAAGNTLTQAEALQMLTSLYGGAASSFAGTFAGKQAVVAAELKNSAAQIGVALLPAAVDLAKVLQDDLLPPIVSTAQWLDRNRATIEPLAKAILIGVAAWKSYVIWTRLAAASNALFVRSAAVTAVSATAAGAAVGATAARAAGSAAITAGGAGSVIGTQMAANLGTSQLGLASSALLAARNIGLMGGAALGFVNFISNPRSLGFPSGFNKDLGIGSVHKGQHLTLPDGTTTTVTGVSTQFFDKAGHAFSDPGLKHPIEQTKQLKAATDSLTTSENALGAAAARTAAQIVAAARKSLDLSAAQDNVRQAMHDAAQTAADTGRALVGNSNAALANRDAIRNEVNAVLSVIDAMKQHGASAARQKSMLDVLTQAVETQATKLYGDKAAVDALLRSLGLIPDEAAAAAAALNAVVSAMPALNTALQTDRITKGTITQLQVAQTQVAAAKAQGAKVAASFDSGYSPIIAKSADKASKSLSTAMDTAKQKMLSDLSTIRDTLSSTQRQVASFADFSAQGTDALGASGRNSDVAGQLKAKAAQLKQFAALFTRLDRAHLDPHLMAQFASIGPDAIPAMQALLASGAKGISRVNRIEASIQHSAAQIARTEVKEQDAGQIHRDLQTLPPKFARAFAKELKHLHLSVSLKESDWKNGKGVVVSP